MKRSIPPVTAFVVIILCAVVAGFFITTRMSGSSSIISAENTSATLTFDGSFFEVDAPNADKVELWVVTPDGKEESWGDLEVDESGVWRISPPDEPRQVEMVEVRLEGGEEETVAWEVVGVDSIATLLWGPKDSLETALSLEESARFGDLRITLKSILEDSRCPAEVQCVTTGELAGHVFVTSPKVRETYVLVMGEPHIFGDYSVELTGASPERTVDQQSIPPEEYEVSFRFLVTPSYFSN